MNYKEKLLLANFKFQFLILPICKVSGKVAPTSLPKSVRTGTSSLFILFQQATSFDIKRECDKRYTITLESMCNIPT
jgi:hypothetical protein